LGFICSCVYHNAVVGQRIVAEIATAAGVLVPPAKAI
jgi:hypothetical protein